MSSDDHLIPQNSRHDYRNNSIGLGLYSNTLNTINSAGSQPLDPLGFNNNTIPIGVSSSEVHLLQAPSLTRHVWPKSRMLFAIVSKMSKEGVISNEQQRGALKDMILEQDQRLMDCLADYESQGDRQKLYQGFIQIADQAIRAKNQA